MYNPQAMLRRMRMPNIFANAQQNTPLTALAYPMLMAGGGGGGGMAAPKPTAETPQILPTSVGPGGIKPMAGSGPQILPTSFGPMGANAFPRPDAFQRARRKGGMGATF